MWKNIYKKIEKKKYNRQEVLLIKSLHLELRNGNYLTKNNTYHDYNNVKFYVR